MTYDELNTAIAALEAAPSPATNALLAQLLLERGEMRRKAHNPDGAMEDAKRAMQLDPSITLNLSGHESIS